MTSITVEQFREMTDEQLLSYVRRFPYKSQYQNKSAYEHAEYRLALMQGANYMRTGKLSAFTSRPA